MFENFAHSARSVVEDARNEAGRRGDRRLGTDHLLLALLHDEDLARVVGVPAATASEAADRLDRDALATIGLQLGAFQPTVHTARREQVPLTAGAKNVLHQTLVSAASEKARAITSRHILLALLDQHEPDPAAALLAALSIDRERVRDRLTSAD